MPNSVCDVRGMWDAVGENRIGSRRAAASRDLAAVASVLETLLVAAAVGAVQAPMGCLCGGQNYKHSNGSRSSRASLGCVRGVWKLHFHEVRIVMLVARIRNYRL